MYDCSRMSDLELLKVVLGKRTAESLYRGKLTPLFEVGQTPVRRLLASQELVRRWLHEDMQGRRIFKHPTAVRRYLTTLYSGAVQERFHALFLDNQHRLIAAEELARGTIDSASVYPREVVRCVLRLNAAAVIFAHNHPSGVAEPSSADRALTERLKAALAVIDVRVLDHFVVGGISVVSFAERGWL